MTATGTLQPTNQVDVASEISGIIDRVFVDFNDNVTQGQIIAQLDTQTLEARAASTRASLAVAEASLAQAQATVTEARAKAARSRELAARNIASQQTLETDEAAAQRAVAAVASATAQVTVSTATLRESETALRKAVIRADRRRDHFARDSPWPDGRGLVSDAGAFQARRRSAAQC